jgi:hypothetical protein
VAEFVGGARDPEERGAQGNRIDAAMAGSARASHVPAVYVEPTTRRDISLIDVNGSSRLLWAGVTPPDSSPAVSSIR